MARSVAGCGALLVWGLCCAQPAAAEAGAAAEPAPTVLLVMEAASGVRAAAALRSALGAQPGVRVVSLAEFSKQAGQPTALLTVAAVAAHEVTVVYWDLRGGRDTLSAPAPARADQIDAVVLALSSALLDRHRLEWSAGAADSGDSDLVRTTDALYAVLGRYGRFRPRSRVALRFEDF